MLLLLLLLAMLPFANILYFYGEIHLARTGSICFSALMMPLQWREQTPALEQGTHLQPA